MNRRQSQQLERKGAVMALLLLVIIILSIAGVGLLELGLRSRTLAVRNASEIEARCAADAGLVKAVFEMNEKLKVTPWDDSILPQATNEVLPNCGATFSYTVTGDLGSGYTIEAVGKSGQAVKRANCALQLQGPFEAAIFANANIILRAGTVVDWYNYSEGEKNFKLGTNSINPGGIDLKNGVFVNGDVVVGLGGDPDVVVINSLGATITGDIYALTERYNLSPITVPGPLQQSSSEGTITDTTTITTSGKYDGINLGNSEIITIDGPVALNITGDVILDNSAQLQIVDAEVNPNASLTLYLGGNFVSKNGGLINNVTADPRKLKVYGLDTCQLIDFKTNSIFYGAIYAPNADVQLNAWVEYSGACTSKSFTQNVHADFNYDASLREVNKDEEAVRFIIKQWSEE